MQLGFIGLGRMGSNMVERLLEHGHEVVARNRSQAPIDAAVAHGAIGSTSIEDLVGKLQTPRVIFIMVQSQHVEGIVDELMPLLSPGDTIIDSGNTYFEDTLARVEASEVKGIHFVDVGVSGGVERARTGATLMVGGPKEIVDRLTPVFTDLAQQDGFGYMGSSGAGHFVKMVHNGIEYGMMQAIGEGLQAIDDNRERFGTDLAEVLKAYNHGSIVESSLTKWTEQAWIEDPGLVSIEGSVPKGDTEEEMQKLAGLANMPALSVALSERARSRTEPSLSAKFVAAMRKQFGNHPVLKKADPAS